MNTKSVKKAIVTLASMMLTCFVSFADANPYSVQYTVSGYAGAEELTNFPVLVRLAANSPLGFAYADCASGGADLTFKDDNGNVIPREIDTWNTAGESLVWVSVPVVTNGASFTMHYGDTYVAAQPACQTDGSVWSADFKGVWHMNSVDPADSSPSGYNGTHQTANLSVTNGPLGAAVIFPRTTTGDGISCGTGLANSQLTDGFTVEGWCRPTQYGGMGDGAAMFGKKQLISIRIATSSQVTVTTPGKSDHKLTNLALPAVGEWWHWAVTFKMNTASTGLHFYVNGQLVKTVGAGDINDKTGTTELFLGNNEWNQAFKGDLDELRLSTGLRSSDWVAASYATQHATDFLTAGPLLGGTAPVLDDAAATPSYTDAQLSVTLLQAGADATSASVSFAYGSEGGALSAPVVLAAAATDGQTLTTNLTGLAVGTAYRYVFTATNDLPIPLSHMVEGSFSTLPPTAPTLEISANPVGEGSQHVGAVVTDIGGGSSCDLYFAYGTESDPIPAYVHVGTNLTAGAVFSRILEGLEFGTTYRYSFAVTNDLELGTVENGTFTAGAGYLPTARFLYNAKFTVSGYTGTEVLTNFPVLVRLAADSPVAFGYGDCAADGSDIRFADAAGRLIPHEIDTWDTTGTSLIWVQVPTLSGTTTEFTMYCGVGNPSGLPAVASSDVWTNANYNAVWHFSGDARESANGLAISDSDGTPDYTATTFGVGTCFKTTGSATIGYNADAKWTTLGSGNTLTVSTWAKYDGATEQYARMVSAMSDYTRPAGWELTVQKGIDEITVGSSSKSQYQYTATGVGPGSGNVYLTAVYNADKTAELYVNGVLAKSASLNKVVTPTDKLWIGSSNKSNNKWNGSLDEIRIHRDAESADWVKACYDTMASATFLTVGPRLGGASPILANAAATPSHTYAQLSVWLAFVGAGATSATVTFVYGPEGGALSAPVVLAASATDGQTLSASLTGLAAGTTYAYSFAATNNLGVGTVETGTFTTDDGHLTPAFFPHRTKFAVTGYTGTEVLTNFPVLVRLSTDSPVGFDYADCAEGGSDIRFSDADGNLIPHEIETWNTSGESLIWVGLPIARDGTAFTMYYGSTDPGDTSTDDVWANYVAVIHGGSSISNSVAGGPAASAGSASVSAAAAAGIIGGGVNKSSNNSIGLNIVKPSAALANTGKYSISAWFKRDGNGGNNNGTHVLGGSRPDWKSGTGYVWLQEQGNYISVSANNAHQFTSGKYTLPDGAWAHAAFTYDSGVALTTYFNGAQDNKKTSGIGNLVSTAATWTFGSYQNKASKDSFKGDMDELRIYNGVASGDRIKAEYDTMSSDAFLAAGPILSNTTPEISLLDATYNAGDFTGNVSFRVTWAGAGYETDDVKIIWGYSPNSLIHTNDMVTGVIGFGTDSFRLIADKGYVYVRAIAVNGGGAVGLSSETLSFYVEENERATIDYSSPLVGCCGVERFGGIYAVVTGAVISAGNSSANPATCLVRVKVGQSKNTLASWVEDRLPAGVFSLNVTNLQPATEYWYCVEVVDDAGISAETVPDSFTTFGGSTLATASVSVDQRTFSLSGSLDTIGADTTHVFVKWGNGDYKEIATFNKDSTDKSFGDTFTAGGWDASTAWTVLCSNECATVEGEMSGIFLTDSLSGSATSADTATYTWQAVDGDWNGSWTNAAHWACNKADRRDYPYGGNETIVFNNNTVATVEVPGDYSFNYWLIEKSGIDVIFVGQGAATSALRGNVAGGAVANSSWTFSAMTLAESNGLDFGKTSVVNSTITFTDGAVGSTGSGPLTLAGSNVWLVVENGAAFNSTVRNGTKDGGIRLDNGTVSGDKFRTDYNWNATTNEWVVFSGAAPRLAASNSFRNESTAAQNLQNADTTFIFSVPRNGWAAAPLYAEYSSAEKFGGMLGTGAGGYVLAIDPKSPAFKVSVTNTVQLVDWRSGIDTNHVWLATQQPEDVALSWTYGWPSTLAEPENEGDAPTGVKATIVGRAKCTMILVW